MNTKEDTTSFYYHNKSKTWLRSESCDTEQTLMFANDLESDIVYKRKVKTQLLILKICLKLIVFIQIEPAQSQTAHFLIINLNL